MFFFSSTLLLAATCLLVRAAEKVTTCNPDTVHRLSCDLDGVISVQSALYGRVDSVTCSEEEPPNQISNTDCSLEGIGDAVKKRCDGKMVCELNKNDLTASDPCTDTAKYLQTTYTCLPAIHRVTCEHSVAYLQCDQGQVIFVYGADYGRRDKSTCVYGRPESQIENSVCSNPTVKVADSCNGKNSCIIKASNSVFGDPCVGTYKYLEVAYACQYPVVSPDESV
ncbi:L-rhamnose-binding lectin SML-like isoform 2-T2 [Odontesthes bonariensis]|uniref:L-rhamnose-binding lectin SML-like isoform X2 n=1 Tax=Odontesthes bonariensis TaxID=219752 RepID=UPI003F58603E